MATELNVKKNLSKNNKKVMRSKKYLLFDCMAYTTVYLYGVFVDIDCLIC